MQIALMRLEILKSPMVAQMYLQLCRTQTVANTDNRPGHLVAEMVDHLNHITAVIIPGRCELLVMWDILGGKSIPRSTHGHFRDYFHSKSHWHPGWRHPLSKSSECELHLVLSGPGALPREAHIIPMSPNQSF
jgi:hypothetical protein